MFSGKTGGLLAGMRTEDTACPLWCLIKQSQRVAIWKLPCVLWVPFLVSCLPAHQPMVGYIGPALGGLVDSKNDGLLGNQVSRGSPAGRGRSGEGIK